MKKLHQSVLGCFTLLLATLPLAQAQPRHSEEIVSTPPTALTGADILKQLDDFRHSRLDGDFCLQFELLHRPPPRQGAETRYTGVAWGTWIDQAPVTRFRISEAVPKDKAAKPATWEWLVRNGATPRVWVLAPGATAAREVPAGQWRAPLFPGTVYTPFDLLAPFVYWADFTYGGTARKSGLGVDIFTMKPSVTDEAAGFGPVRISVNREYKAIVRAEYLDAKGVILKQLDLGDFAPVQEQYVPKMVDLEDQKTHFYDRFQVKAAALKLQLDGAIFDPAKLAQPAPVPPEKAWSSL